MRYAIWIALAALLVLHQDFWFWDDRSVVLGFLPIGLAYHIGISLAAAALWWLATRVCWPDVQDHSAATGSGATGSAVTGAPAGEETR